MKWLSAGLTSVNVATICGLLLGIISRGIGGGVATVSLFLGVLAGAVAWLTTVDPNKPVLAVTPRRPPKPKPEAKLSKRAQRRLAKKTVQSPPPPPEPEPVAPPASSRRRNIWLWLLGACFVMFAVRSFCWLIYADSEQLRIQSPHNSADLALHMGMIRYFANGIPLWPENLIYWIGKLRYPAGIDLFNALLFETNLDLVQGLVWVGLLASAATFYAFYRWGGPFAIAGFLFNGGLVGFQYIWTFKFLDYQADKAIAWKSIPLTMFVTQRGLLYAIPAGLLLLWHWRKKFFVEPATEDAAAVAGGADPGPATIAADVDPATEIAQPAEVNVRTNNALPFWLELSLYASMPLFHIHTFVALTITLIFLVLCGDGQMRKDIGKLLLSALLPALFFLWLVTDHFHAFSFLSWQPGWLQAGGETEREFARPFFVTFWLVNFGVWLPLVLTFVGLIGWRFWKTGFRWGEKLPPEIIFPIGATAIFLLVLFVRTGASGWDNMKLLIWAYFILLPFLWRYLLALWPLAARIIICIALFGSGFVSLIGGLAAGRPGQPFANRAEIYAVGRAVRELPAEARFAAFPAINHPLLLQGRKLVMGNPTDLKDEGITRYEATEHDLRELMLGAPNWREIVGRVGVRYIYWGREEAANYQASKRPWEQTAVLATTDKSWGSIYDLEQAKK